MSFLMCLVLLNFLPKIECRCQLDRIFSLLMVTQTAKTILLLLIFLYRLEPFFQALLNYQLIIDQ